MEHRRARLVSTAGILSLGVLAACGTTNNTTTGGGGGGGLDSCTGSVTVASDLPVSGSDASDGIPTQNGATLAVEQANASKLLGGCTIKYTPMDDASVALGKHDPALGAQNITALAGNPAVLGVAGPFNSSVAKAELPIANRAGLVMISPANTNPGLTVVGADTSIDTNSLRPTGAITYFRVCTTDIGQGKGLAQAATQKLHNSKAFVFDDQETYGQGLARFFTQFFTQNGGTIVGKASLPGTTTDFKTQLTQAKSAGADLIFFGGTSSNGGGIIRAQMGEAGLGSSVTYMGGDGIVDDEFFKQAGDAGNGAYGTIAAPDPTKLSSAAKFVSDYKARFGTDTGAYSANEYDAMNVILNAIKAAVQDNGGKLISDPTAFRKAVRDKVAAISYDGAIGHTAFDKNGDTTNILLTLEVGQNKKWAYSATLTLT